jgi:hypothetical protein
MIEVQLLTIKIIFDYDNLAFSEWMESGYNEVLSLT